MRHHPTWIAALIMLVAAVAPARGDYVSLDVGGPGGNGFASRSTTNVALFDITYGAVDYVDITLTVNSGGTYQLLTAFSDIHILNVTNQHWLSFTFEALSGVTFQSATETHLPADFATITVTPGLVTYSGGTGVDSSNFFFYPGLTFTAPSAGTFVIRATPHLDAVPEPASLALLGLGSAGLVGLARRRRVRSAR